MPSVSMTTSVVADRVLQFAGEPRKVLVADRLPEERLDALEAVRQNSADVGGRVRRVRLDHRADADVANRIAHAPNRPSRS